MYIYLTSYPEEDTKALFKTTHIIVLETIGRYVPQFQAQDMFRSNIEEQDTVLGS